MLRDGPVTDASARRCLGLPFEWHAKTPGCEPSRYLCTVCRRSCGFCTAPSAECADTAPESECLSSTDRSQRTTAARVLPTGACDDAMFMSTRRAAEVGAWEFGIHGWVFAANGSRPHVPNLASERAAALRSLRETTAVFIGDSNQRHQYSALAYFLQHSVWPPARNYSNFSVTNAASVFADSQLGRPGLQEVNSMLRGRMPRSRGSRDAVWKWRTFYNQSSAMLGDACECEMRDGLQIENRFFSIAPAGAKASESRSGVQPGVRLAYLGSQGNGHATVLADDTWAAGWSDLLGGVRRACDAGACTPGAIRADNARFVASRLAPLKPDIIVFGPGPWMRADMAATAALLRAMRGTLAPGGRAIFRTCPRGSTQGAGHQGCSNTRSCDETFRALLAETGWEALDIFALTDSLWAALSLARTNASRPSPYADRYHFHADIYREWNRALLRLLGGSTRARRVDGGRRRLK